MTPLAHAIAKQALVRPKLRKLVRSAETKEIIDPESLVSDIHCFECSDVLDLACELTDSGRLEELAPDQIFLPAPRTWIEHKDRDGRRAWLLSEEPLRAHLILNVNDQYWVKEQSLSSLTEVDHSFTGLVLSMLAIINAPHIVNREAFQPNRGLVRMWQRRFRSEPLNAWHELKLRINKPIEIEDDEPHAAEIGGRRALHFCRAHLRIRLGRLEFVTSHWRGDPALGTKLARYRVTK